jgi:hypothetical protein
MPAAIFPAQDVSLAMNGAARTVASKRVSLPESAIRFLRNLVGEDFARHIGFEVLQQAEDGV